MFFDENERALCYLHHGILTGEEFVELLSACASSDEGQLGSEPVVARNRALLWVLYDTGIHVSELIHLRMGDVDRQQRLIAVKGRGAKHRRIAMGRNCWHHFLSYLDEYRPTQTEFAELGNPGEDHVFLSEIGQPLTTSDMTALFTTLKERAGLTDTYLHLLTFRDTFAVRYLELSHDTSSLQKLLGEEDMTTITWYRQLSQVSRQSVAHKESRR
jgi:site-specific recombinase XerD